MSSSPESSIASPSVPSRTSNNRTDCLLESATHGVLPTFAAGWPTPRGTGTRQFSFPVVTEMLASTQDIACPRRSTIAVSPRRSTTHVSSPSCEYSNAPLLVSQIQSPARPSDATSLPSADIATDTLALCVRRTVVPSSWVHPTLRTVPLGVAALDGASPVGEHWHVSAAKRRRLMKRTSPARVLRLQGGTKPADDARMDRSAAPTTHLDVPWEAIGAARVPTARRDRKERALSSTEARTCSHAGLLPPCTILETWRRPLGQGERRDDAYPSSVHAGEYHRSGGGTLSAGPPSSLGSPRRRSRNPSRLAPPGGEAFEPIRFPASRLPPPVSSLQSPVSGLLSPVFPVGRLPLPSWGSCDESSCRPRWCSSGC